jgi:LysR family transcriptional regulator, low CO2-responsive transcriptional regulator
MQVKQLEEQIGLALVDQIGKRLFLTEGGHELLGHARGFAAKMMDLSAAMDQFRGLERGILRLAVVSTASYFLPRLVVKFTERYPGVRISLNVVNRDAVLSALAENRTDLAITGRPPEGSDVVAYHFMDNPLAVIAAPHHKLAQLDRISPNLLGEEIMMIREQGSGTRAATERYFLEHGLEHRSGCEVSTNEAVKQAVQAGLGLGIAPAQTIELELETKRLVILPVEGFPIHRQWFVVHRTDKRLSAAAQAFFDLLLTQDGKAARPDMSSKF